MRLLAVLLLLAASCAAQQYAFAPGFRFGVATSAYQVEGAWNLSGKGENIWDWLTRERSYLILDGSNGDVAADSYHKTEEDVQLLRSLEVNFYRFSLSWTRLLPSGHTDAINPDGLRYYNELIDELIAYNITPMVTIFHWDTPQDLQEIGGFPNPSFRQWFVDFADIVYDAFGDRVKEWITINEPMQICHQGYGVAQKAPAYTQDALGSYLCGHTLLLAHADAYRLYYEKYSATQGGRVGITIDSGWFEPDSDDPVVVETVDRQQQMIFGWWAHPIFSEEGDYPPVMRQRVDEMSLRQGFPRSRLPVFTPEEVEHVKGTADFFGLNHYATSMCHPSASEYFGFTPSMYTDIGVDCYNDPEWEGSASTWVNVVPWGLRRLLNWVRTQYNNPEVIITENGFSDWGELQDCRRVNYYNGYLNAVLEAIYEDGCNVTGYTAWSFIDNFEWMEGYTVKLGLIQVDFDDDDRPRTPKFSSHIYRNIIQTRSIDWDFVPPGWDANTHRLALHVSSSSEAKQLLVVWLSVEFKRELTE